MTTHWAQYIRHWELLGPPLRPHQEVVKRVVSLIGAGATPCLLLGSTVEYAALGSRIIAMDMTFPMVAGLWRQGDPSRLGIQADWTSMPVRSHTVGHLLGDGSLNAVPWSVLPAMIEEVRRVLQPRGALIARVFCRPRARETLEDIRRDVIDRRVGSFHALKWRVAMAMLDDEGGSDIAVKDIRRVLMAGYPDREELCRVTGWNRAEVDTIDAYENSDAIYNFPTDAMIAALLRRWFAEVELVRCGTYPLAERCPIIVARGTLSAE
jgi:hypothetical protein